MERFFDAVFVLRRAAEPGWPLWKRGVFYLYRVLLLLCAAAGLGAVLLLCAYGPYMWRYNVISGGKPQGRGNNL